MADVRHLGFVMRVFQTVGPSTEKARRRRGTNSCWHLADRRRCREAMSEIGMSRCITHHRASRYGEHLRIRVGTALAEEHPASAARLAADGMGQIALRD